jgi:phenylpyruvate tautomerase PptA (4-oxalocrotonate tautomerase family)
MRVQIPAYTDRWMMGDRFGEVVRVIQTRRIANRVRASLLTKAMIAGVRDVAVVKLDKSNRTIRVILDDCQEV